MCKQSCWSMLAKQVGVHAKNSGRMHVSLSKKYIITYLCSVVCGIQGIDGKWHRPRLALLTHEENYFADGAGGQKRLGIKKFLGKLPDHRTCCYLDFGCMMMIAFITIKSSLVPLIEGLCAQIYFRFEISVVCSHLLLFFFVKEKTC